MGLFNKKNEQASSILDECTKLVSQTTVSNSDYDNIIKQISSVIEELEAIGQTVDPTEVVSEVLEQNDYEFIVSKQKKIEEKTLKIKTGAREVILTNEPINKLNLEVKLGAATLDLRNFDFNGGDLLINLKSSFSGIEIYVNSDVAVHDWIENKYSGVSYNINGIDYDNIAKLDRPSTNHTITLEGRIKGSGVTFRFDHEGDYIHDMSHHGSSIHAKNNESLDSKLNLELDRIDSQAEKNATVLKIK